jgi:hypothetical protein
MQLQSQPSRGLRQTQHPGHEKNADPRISGYRTISVYPGGGMKTKVEGEIGASTFRDFVAP